MSEWPEASIIINGELLNAEQVSTFRVAILTMECSAGSDDYGRKLTESYQRSQQEIFRMMRQVDKPRKEKHG